MYFRGRAGRQDDPCHIDVRHRDVGLLSLCGCESRKLVLHRMYSLAQVLPVVFMKFQYLRPPALVNLA